VADEPTAAGRALERLEEITLAHEAGTEPSPSDVVAELEATATVREVLASNASDMEDVELWNRVGAVLRVRAPESYRLLRGIAVTIGALLDADVVS
jgi:hypothetical protein